ncbi:hypothetical protein JW890_05160 [candidate division WOR-3 bacterium]|nr:hypothetical protein [candidate division WOR-3 bacterium]
MFRVIPRGRSAIGLPALILVLASVFAETAVFVDSASVEVIFTGFADEDFVPIKPRKKHTDAYSWLETPDFDPSRFFYLFNPRTNAQKSLFSSNRDYFIEDFYLTDRVFGTDLFDGEFSFYPRISFSAMRQSLAFRISQDPSRLPRTRISHGRIGGESEYSSLNFSREFFDTSEICLGGFLARGNEGLPFTDYESQKGYFRLKTPLRYFHFDGYFVHAYQRTGKKDSLPSKTTFDIGQITLTKSIFGASYGYFYSNSENFGENAAEKTQSAEIFVRPFRTADVKIRAKAEYFSAREDTIIYSAGAQIQHEIFHLTWLKADLTFRSDSSRSADIFFIYRPALNYSLYSGFSDCYHKQPFNDPQRIYHISRSAKSFYAGTRFLGEKAEFDAAVCYDAYKSSWEFSQNEWLASEEKSGFRGSLYSLYSPSENFSFGIFAVIDTIERGCLFTSFSKNFFKDDLSVFISPGLIAQRDENNTYYPWFRIKLRVLNLFCEWRIQFEKEDYLIDYGVIWLFTN